MGVFDSIQKGRRESTQKGKINLEKATDSGATARLTKIMYSMNNDKNPDTWTID